MAPHSHDNIDWDARLERLRDTDALTGPETAELVKRLLRPEDRSVVDVGAGAGGSAAAFAKALSGTGDTVTVVDSAPELLAAAADCANRAASGGVDVRAVRADAADDALPDLVGQVDLVFASFVAHHLPDQIAGLRRMARMVRPGGRLALVEFGLEHRVLPWDIGLGEPGLESRLAAARDDRFRRMRAEMEGSVRMPMGWSAALSEAGLDDVESWSYLIDRPAPASGPALNAAVRRLEWLREAAEETAGAEDLQVLDQLLDPESPHFLRNRLDVQYLVANTVHVGTKPTHST
ncbi:methyltransferase domain-containing protein [Saccharopolyspora erythraea]|uniref:class I SAM-dependent methyltransferase n=1 Tax=Saccharopolyspora erythraea TaxID=1836 RepID=UPI001BAC4EF6|nr:methyltransferase domain-containing protein [Saccharopolyspora erythraea]QUH00345.1 methyltransferase domain-containing protein [Saccharopolyspora erythraea]